MLLVQFLGFWPDSWHTPVRMSCWRQAMLGYRGVHSEHAELKCLMDEHFDQLQV